MTAQVLPVCSCSAWWPRGPRRPLRNGQWIDEAFLPGDGVHLGVAVSLPGGGLAALVVRDPDTFGIAELRTRVREAGNASKRAACVPRTPRARRSW